MIFWSWTIPVKEPTPWLAILSFDCPNLGNFPFSAFISGRRLARCWLGDHHRSKSPVPIQIHRQTQQVGIRRLSSLGSSSATSQPIESQVRSVGGGLNLLTRDCPCSQQPDACASSADDKGTPRIKVSNFNEAGSMALQPTPNAMEMRCKALSFRLNRCRPRCDACISEEPRRSFRYMQHHPYQTHRQKSRNAAIPSVDHSAPAALGKTPFAPSWGLQGFPILLEVFWRLIPPPISQSCAEGRTDGSTVLGTGHWVTLMHP